MDQSTQSKNVRTIISIQSNGTPEKAIMAYRFDVFKGSVGADGKITKIRSVGSAYVREGHQTYTLTLKTFLKDRFYLLPNTKEENAHMDYVILTREPAQRINRKYFWNSVGAGQILDGDNHGLMKLSWDVLADDIYMSLHPVKVGDPAEAAEAAAA